MKPEHKKIMIVSLLVVTLVLIVAIGSSVINKKDVVDEVNGEEDIEDIKEYDEILNVTVYKTSSRKRFDTYEHFLYCTNNVRYEIAFPFNNTVGDYLIGKELTICVDEMHSTYDIHYEQISSQGHYRVVCDKWVKEYEIIGENITIRKAYDLYVSYTTNLSCLEELEITGNESIDLPILDKYGRNIHYTTEFEITIHNPCNISTYLITNFSHYDCNTVLSVSCLPSDLNNRYFVITYPENIVLEPYETVSYPFTIEIYGSSEQLFFPKEYQIDFELRNKGIVKSFSLDVSLSEY